MITELFERYFKAIALWDKLEANTDIPRDDLEQRTYLAFLGYEPCKHQSGSIKTPSGRILDKAAAESILSHQLKVGDSRQIEALHVLEVLALGI